jgi:hypothetical protein
VVRPGIDGTAFDPEALANDIGGLGDDVDAYAISHAWYGYAQEALPRPGKLPGSSQPITDRTLHRLPRHMTTLIFRHYPAMARRYQAERLQQEGWFDDAGWNIAERDDRDWKRVGQELRSKHPAEKGRIGTQKSWSQDAWNKAQFAWKKHGLDNKLLLTTADEENYRNLAKRFWDRMYVMKRATPPEVVPDKKLTRREKKMQADAMFGMPPAQEPNLTEDQEKELYAAQYLFEWKFYRGVSNFDAHYHRSLVESQPITVAVRKLFFQAEELDLSGNWPRALDIYRQKRTFPGQDSEPRTPLEAWRDLVLLKNQAYRDLDDTQQQAAEIQLNYLDVYDKEGGREQKELLGRAAAFIPLLPPITVEEFPYSIVQGPFDVTDEEGEPLINPVNMARVLERKGRPVFRPPSPRPSERQSRPDRPRTAP